MSKEKEDVLSRVAPGATMPATGSTAKSANGLSAHTPGPWFVGTQNDAMFIIDKRPRPSTDYPVHDAKVASIAHVYYGNHADANARLLAAAPELLSALKRLRDLPVDCSQQDDNEAWRVAHEAIAKAEGAS